MRARALTLSALLSCAPLALQAQNFTGTYQFKVPTGGVLTLSLKQNAAGHATGSLAGNGSNFPIDAKIKNKNLVGKAGEVYFEAALEGDEVEVVLADIAANGQPDFQNAKQLIFERQSTAAAAPAAPAASPAPRGNPLGGSSANPLAGRGAASAQPGSQAAPAADAQSQQLTRLLLSSNWCTFSYNATSGRSSSSKSTYRPDGWVVSSTNGEGGTMNSMGGTSVAGGSYYSQQQGGGQAQWKVQGGQLYLNFGQGFVLVPLQFTQNSNGSVIAKANGVEYSQCQ